MHMHVGVYVSSIHVYVECVFVTYVISRSHICVWSEGGRCMCIRFVGFGECDRNRTVFGGVERVKRKDGGKVEEAIHWKDIEDLSLE